MNNMSLSKDDIETILINLNASKEDLCNRGLWNIAEEYQQLIDKILVNFADTLGEKVNEYVPELSPAAEPEPKWIPVTVALPEMKEVVLITNGKGHVRCGQYQGTFADKNYRWWWKHNTLEEVIAWMPLPRPAIIGDVK